MNASAAVLLWINKRIYLQFLMTSFRNFHPLNIFFFTLSLLVINPRSDLPSFHKKMAMNLWQPEIQTAKRQNESYPTRNCHKPFSLSIVSNVSPHLCNFLPSVLAFNLIHQLKLQLTIRFRSPSTQGAARITTQKQAGANSSLISKNPRTLCALNECWI